MQIKNLFLQDYIVKSIPFRSLLYYEINIFTHRGLYIYIVPSF